jgi:hypothetical protein
MNPRVRVEMQWDTNSLIIFKNCGLVTQIKFERVLPLTWNQLPSKKEKARAIFELPWIHVLHNGLLDLLLDARSKFDKIPDHQTAPSVSLCCISSLTIAKEAKVNEESLPTGQFVEAIMRLARLHPLGVRKGGLWT